MPQQAKNPRFKLANFLKNLALEPMVLGDTAPPMPHPLSRSTSMPLKMLPGGVRHLKEMRVMKSFESDAKRLFEEKIRKLNTDTLKSLKSLQLHAQEPKKKPTQKRKTNPCRFTSRNDVKLAVQRGPVKDACALAKVISTAPMAGMSVHKATASISESEKQDRKSHPIEPIFIRNSHMTDRGCKLGSVKCIVVPVAPWEFSRKDFQDFTTSQKWPDRNAVKDRIRDKSLTNANLMWAYVHDLCVRHKCSNFVLTSYEMWAFGLFSPYYTLGFVSNAFPCNRSSPSLHCSVLQMFVYWILIAFNLTVPADLCVEADYKNAQEYKYFNETPCSIGDILDVDPGAVFALCHAS